MTTKLDSVDSQREIIARNGFAISKTSGRSMRPLIWGGRHCVVVVALEREPTVGDILMFELPTADTAGGSSKKIVHRLVEIRHGEEGRKEYVMQGDNNLHCETIAREQIIGRVTEVHRLGAYRPWHAIGKRKFTVEDPAYRRYLHLLEATRPLRRIYYRLRGFLSRLTIKDDRSKKHRL
ncbi:MAG: S24/S26 family peptidase [Muribaculaceae bacterium]|nr:S24/S26 family peptidase [Muribaculaceae bacterium]